jgi:hypothetical protein
MADFSLLQTPNFAQAVLSGYSAGQSLGKQQRLDNALGGVDLERPETIIPILQVDPSTGAALLGTSVRYAEMKHEQNKANALGSALSDYFKGQSGDKPSGTVSVPAAPAAAPPVSAPTSPTTADPNEITITAPRTHAPDMGQTVAALVQNGASLEQAQHFVGLVGSMNDQHKAALGDAQDAIGHAALQLRNLPPEQRRAALDQMAPDLLQHHVTMDQINAADLSDGGLEGIWNQSVGIKDVLAGQRADREHADLQAQRGVDNKFRSQEIGISARNANTSAGGLAVTQKRLRDEEQGILGKDGKTPVTGMQDNLPQPMTQAAYNDLAKGTRFRAPDGTVRIKP